MEYRLELMVLLVFLATVSSAAPSREEFTEAVVRKCRKAETPQFSVSYKITKTKALVNSQLFLGSST